MPARVTLGTGLLSGRTTPAAARRLVDAALAAGVRSFDTARAYGDGETEWFLGRALRGRPDVEVVTKVGLGPLERRRSADVKWRVASPLLARVPRGAVGAGGGPAPVARLDAASVRRSVDLSRRALRRDRLDLLLLHEVDAATGGDALADQLDALVAAGSIAAWGTATRRDALDALVAAGVRLGSRVQAAGGPLQPPIAAPPGATLGIHSVLGPGATRLTDLLRWVDTGGRRAAWERLVGPVSARRTAGEAVLRVAGSTPGVEAVIVSSRDPRALVRSIEAVQVGDAPERLAAIGALLDEFRGAA